ncbi:hypothetical protein BD311DRAFT_761189, partial [Dichomitus squalens]
GSTNPLLFATLRLGLVRFCDQHGPQVACCGLLDALCNISRFRAPSCLLHEALRIPGQNSVTTCRLGSVSPKTNTRVRCGNL